MAGGTWLSQNKVRAGAYINFKAVPKSSMTVGDRGIVAIPLNLDWGEEGKLIEVLSTDLYNNSSNKLVGFNAFDIKTSTPSKIVTGALNYCYKAFIYRMNSGTKASAILGNLTVTAKYNGTYGNKLMVGITQDSASGLFEIVTYVNGAVVDKQKVQTIAELENNDYVDFSGDGSLEINAGTALVGGTSTTGNEAVAYPEFLNLLSMARWQTLACLSSDVTIKASIQTFINQMRNDEGKYVQGVVADYDGADSEGIINSINGVTIDNLDYSKEEFVAIVAGMTAGANFNESNTARKINGATKIIGQLNDTQIINALSSGKFVLSTSASGNIKVEQDINSLHTFTSEKNYAFSKNRVIRTLDEIGTTTKITWEDTYMGKVDNNDTGRGLFKADLSSYGNELQRLGGIQDFDSVKDIEVAQGNDLDSVLTTWAVKPVDSMEKLYMTVNVNS